MYKMLAFVMIATAADFEMDAFRSDFLRCRSRQAPSKATHYDGRALVTTINSATHAHMHTHTHTLTHTLARTPIIMI